MNTLHLLAVPLDFLLTLAKMKRKQDPTTEALSWLCCPGLNYQEESAESSTVLGPSAPPLLKLSAARQQSVLSSRFCGDS